MRLLLEIMRRRRAVMSCDNEINTVRDLIETLSLNRVRFLRPLNFKNRHPRAPIGKGG